MAKTKKVLVTVYEDDLTEYKEISYRFKKHFGLNVTLSSLVRHSMSNYLAMMEYLIKNVSKPWNREKILDHFLKLGEKQQMKKEKA
jgi:hypothetical protein